MIKNVFVTDWGTYRFLLTVLGEDVKYTALKYDDKFEFEAIALGKSMVLASEFLNKGESHNFDYDGVKLFLKPHVEKHRGVNG